MLMKNTILVALLMLSFSIFAGGPWLVKKKSGYFELQSTLPFGTYNTLFLENGQDLNLNREVLDVTFQTYLEYGISDKFNLITALPFKSISTGNAQAVLTNPTLLPEGKLNGFGNYKLGFKYKLADKNIKAALSLQGSFNTAKQDLTTGLATGYSSNFIGLYTHVGKSFSEKLYSFIDLGYNTSTNNFSDYIDIHYELGYQLKKSLWTALTFDIRESTKNGSYLNENLRQTGFYTNNQEYFSYGVKASYELKNKMGFTAATFGAFSGNFVSHLATVSLGVYKKW